MARKVDPEHLVAADEVAIIVGLNNPNGVSVYRRRYSSFPQPVVERGRCVLWLRADIETWVRSRNRPGGL